MCGFLPSELSVSWTHSLLSFQQMTNTFIRCRDMLSEYVPKPVMESLNAGKYQTLGELRPVTILFVNLPDFKYETPENMQDNQNAFFAIQKILHRFDGVLRQLIQDDKGTVAILAFGLPYCSHEDDALRGVLTAMSIRRVLLHKIGMKCGIGVTSGGAYCGSVGNFVRCEYAIVGDCVNLSARLMCKSMTKGGILVDHETYTSVANGRKDNNGIGFEQMESIAVKGKAEKVAIYMPSVKGGSHSLQLPDNDATPLLGREAEIKGIHDVMQTLATENQIRALRATSKGKTGSGISTQALLFKGDTGIGKTRLLQTVASEARGADINVFYGSANAITNKTAYSVWKSIIPALLHSIHPLDEATAAGRHVSVDPDTDMYDSAPPHHSLSSISVGSDIELDGNGLLFKEQQLTPYQIAVQTQLRAAKVKPRNYCLLNQFTSANLPESEYIQNMTSTERCDRISRIVLHLFKYVCKKNGPQVLILENLQWFDVMSFNLLAYLLDSNLESPLLIAISARTTASAQDRLRLISSFRCTRAFSLDVLPTECIHSLCLSLTQAKEIPQEMVDIVSKVSGRNPLFVKEVIASLEEHHRNNATAPKVREGKNRGFLLQAILKKSRAEAAAAAAARAQGIEVEEKDDEIPAEKSPLAKLGPAELIELCQKIGVTSSIEQIMTSRIDQLTPVQQEVLKAAAVVGYQFEMSLLCSVSPYPEETVNDVVMSLVESGYVVVGSSTSRASVDVHSPITVHREGHFVNAIMRDVVYKMLSAQSRTAVHAAVASCIEALCLENNPDGSESALLSELIPNIPEYASRIAYHLERCGQTVRSSFYWNLAGELSSQLHSNYAESSNQFMRIIELSVSSSDPITDYSSINFETCDIDAVSMAQWQIRIAEVYIKSGKPLMAKRYLQHACTVLKLPLPTSFDTSSTSSPTSVVARVDSSVASQHDIGGIASVYANHKSRRNLFDLGDTEEEKHSDANSDRSESEDKSNTKATLIHMSHKPPTSPTMIGNHFTFRQKLALNGEGNRSKAAEQNKIEAEEANRLVSREALSKMQLDAWKFYSNSEAKGRARHNLMSAISTLYKVVCQYAYMDKNEHLYAFAAKASANAAEITKSVTHIATSYASMMVSALTFSKIDEAREYYEKSLGLLRQLTEEADKHARAWLLTCMATVDVSTGCWKKAKENLTQAFVLHNEVNNHFNAQVNTYTLCILFRIKGNIAKSSNLFRQLNILAKRLKSEPYLLRSQVGIAENHLIRGEINLALGELEAINHDLTNGVNKIGSDRSLIIRTKGALALSYWRSGQNTKAVSCAYSALNYLRSPTYSLLEAYSSIVEVLSRARIMQIRSSGEEVEDGEEPITVDDEKRKLALGHLKKMSHNLPIAKSRYYFWLGVEDYITVLLEKNRKGDTVSVKSTTQHHGRVQRSASASVSFRGDALGSPPSIAEFSSSRAAKTAVSHWLESLHLSSKFGLPFEKAIVHAWLYTSMTELGIDAVVHSLSVQKNKWATTRRINISGDPDAAEREEEERLAAEKERKQAAVNRSAVSKCFAALGCGSSKEKYEVDESDDDEKETDEEKRQRRFSEFRERQYNSAVALFRAHNYQWELDALTLDHNVSAIYHDKNGEDKRQSANDALIASLVVHALNDKDTAEGKERLARLRSRISMEPGVRELLKQSTFMDVPFELKTKHGNGEEEDDEDDDDDGDFERTQRSSLEKVPSKKNFRIQVQGKIVKQQQSNSDSKEMPTDHFRESVSLNQHQRGRLSVYYSMDGNKDDEESQLELGDQHRLDFSTSWKHALKEAHNRNSVGLASLYDHSSSRKSVRRSLRKTVADLRVLNDFEERTETDATRYMRMMVDMLPRRTLLRLLSTVIPEIREGLTPEFDVLSTFLKSSTVEETSGVVLVVRITSLKPPESTTRGADDDFRQLDNMIHMILNAARYFDGRVTEVTNRQLMFVWERSSSCLMSQLLLHVEDCVSFLSDRFSSSARLAEQFSFSCDVACGPLLYSEYQSIQPAKRSIMLYGSAVSEAFALSHVPPTPASARVSGGSGGEEDLSPSLSLSNNNNNNNINSQRSGPSANGTSFAVENASRGPVVRYSDTATKLLRDGRVMIADGSIGKYHPVSNSVMIETLTRIVDPMLLYSFLQLFVPRLPNASLDHESSGLHTCVCLISLQFSSQKEMVDQLPHVATLLRNISLSHDSVQVQLEYDESHYYSTTGPLTPSTSPAANDTDVSKKLTKINAYSVDSKWFKKENIFPRPVVTLASSCIESCVQVLFECVAALVSTSADIFVGMGTGPGCVQPMKDEYSSVWTVSGVAYERAFRNHEFALSKFAQPDHQLEEQRASSEINMTPQKRRVHVLVDQYTERRIAPIAHCAPIRQNYRHSSRDAQNQSIYLFAAARNNSNKNMGTSEGVGDEPDHMFEVIRLNNEDRVNTEVSFFHSRELSLLQSMIPESVPGAMVTTLANAVKSIASQSSKEVEMPSPAAPVLPPKGSSAAPVSFATVVQKATREAEAAKRRAEERKRRLKESKRLVLLTGQNHVGKAALIERLKSIAFNPRWKCLVLSVVASSPDKNVTWGGIKSLLNQLVLVKTDPSDRGGADPMVLKRQILLAFSKHCSELVPYLPLLNVFFPSLDFEQTTDVSSLGSRAAMTVRVVVALLDMVLQHRPCLIVVGNGQHIDTLSWRCLARITRLFHNVLLVSTCPEIDVDQGVSIHKNGSNEWGFLVEIVKEMSLKKNSDKSQSTRRSIPLREAVNVIHVEELSRSHTESLIMNQLSLLNVPPALLDCVYEHSKGFPAAVEDVCVLLAKNESTLALSFTKPEVFFKSFTHLLTEVSRESVVGHSSRGSVPRFSSSSNSCRGSGLPGFGDMNSEEYILLELASVVGDSFDRNILKALFMGGFDRTSVTEEETQQVFLPGEIRSDNTQTGLGLNVMTQSAISAEDRVADILRTLQHQRVIRPIVAGAGIQTQTHSWDDHGDDFGEDHEFCFSTSGLRSDIYDSIEPERRRQIHNFLATLYEEMVQSSTVLDHALLAHHWLYAKNRVKYMRCVLTTSEVSLRSGAFQDTIQLLHECLRWCLETDHFTSGNTFLLSKKGHGSKSKDSRTYNTHLALLYMQLGLAYSNISHFRKSNECLMNVFTRLGNKTNPSDVDPASAKMHATSLLASLSTDDSSAATGGNKVNILDKGGSNEVLHLIESDDARDIAYVLSHTSMRAFELYAKNCIRTHEPVHGLYAANRAAETARIVGSIPCEAKAFALMSVYCTTLDMHAQGQTFIEKSLQLVNMCTSSKAASASSNHNTAAKGETAIRSGEVAKNRVFYPRSIAFINLHAASRLAGEGQLVKSHALFEDTRSFFNMSEDATWKDIVVQHGCVKILLGDFCGAYNDFSLLLDASRATSDFDHEISALNFLCYLSYHRKEYDEAVRHLEQGTKQCSASGRTSLMNTILRLMLSEHVAELHIEDRCVYMQGVMAGIQGITPNSWTDVMRSILVCDYILVSGFRLPRFCKAVKKLAEHTRTFSMRFPLAKPFVTMLQALTRSHDGKTAVSNDMWRDSQAEFEAMTIPVYAALVRFISGHSLSIHDPRRRLFLLKAREIFASHNANLFRSLACTALITVPAVDLGPKWNKAEESLDVIGISLHDELKTQKNIVTGRQNMLSS